MHPAVHGNSYLSLAEARVPPVSSIILHIHGVTEEVYHIISGFVILGEDKFRIGSGDTICIHPGTAHKVENFSGVELVILCCSAPAYSHDDTYLLENG
jgi:mannose-6-phosphate isomerase-like protein (cupin superfamily)